VAQHCIFIGYRRTDTGGDAGRIFDRLEGKFGQGRVFKDVDSIPRGVKFRDYVPTIIVQCSVFLALIGPGWIHAQDEDGRRRLDDEEDLVRIEIETALRTPGVQVIPVLVAGASMPKRADLPLSLHPIADINAAQMRRDPDFNVDIGRLIRDLEVGAQTGKVVVDAPEPGSGSAGAWAMITTSLDVADYADFIAHYPGAAELIQAARHKRRLEAWATVDKSDPDAIAAFLREPSFAALEQLAKEAMHRAAEAKQRAFEQALAERRAREAAEAEARREAVEAARRAREEDERKLGPAVVRAADAARAGRPVSERAFPIELPGVANWPNPKMIAIPPGRFMMGAAKGEEGASEDEFPQHEVKIDYGFALGQHTVTFAEWDAASAAGAKLEKPSDQGGRRGNRPVINVSWQDAQAYITWLNDKLGLAGRKDAYRLPSEAEWEYACRAGEVARWHFGNDEKQLGEYAWYASNAGSESQPVGQKEPSRFGLFDMHGNVWEWCEDAWHSSYGEAGRPDDGTAWIGPNSSSRVLRGGSWYVDPRFLRSAIRVDWAPTYRYNDIGFRLARTVSPPNR
jgi:formylglycine-generating enzyme required for sulfatase activity